MRKWQPSTRMRRNEILRDLLQSPRYLPWLKYRHGTTAWSDMVALQKAGLIVSSSPFCLTAKGRGYVQDLRAAEICEASSEPDGSVSEVRPANQDLRYRVTDELLQQVAAVYVDTPRAPTKHVASEFDTSHRNATRWVGLARARGFLNGA